MPGATNLIPLPFDAGQREDIDKRLLPQGMFRSVVNMRLRRSGSLAPRREFLPVTMEDIEGDTFNAFDVASHGSQLLVFGSSNLSAGGPEKVFAYVPDRDAWRAEDYGRPRAFPVVSELEEVFRPPFAKTDEAVRYDVAYAGGYVALAYESHADEGAVFVHVIDAESRTQVLESQVPGRSAPRVAAVGTAFLFCWVDSSGDVRAAGFDPSTATALGVETTIHTAGTVVAGVDLGGTPGASEATALVVRSDNGAAALYRLSASGGVLATGALTATDVSLGSVVTDGSGATHVAYVDTGGNYELESFDTSTLVSSVGPTALFSGATGARPPGLAVQGSSLACSAATADTIDSQLRVDVRSSSTHTASSQLTHREVSQQSKPFVSSDEIFVGVVSPYGQGAVSSFAGIFDLLAGRGFECSVHRGFAVDAGHDFLGSVATDGTYHYAAFPVSDLNCSNLPVLMRWRTMSPERRQTARLGDLLYVAGGFVGVWDGHRLVEAGYPDTPVIASATPGNTGTGGMTASAQHSYVVAFEWFDSRGNRHQSPVSAPFEVTMGGSDDSCTVVVSTPHSIRRVVGDNTGGKILLYRTRAFPDRLHRRAGIEFCSGAFAAAVSIVDEATDAEILEQEVVYSQGSRGSLSGPLEHNFARPCQYLWAKRSRLITGRLDNPAEWQQSKELFPSEPVQFSDFPGFFGRVRDDITAVASQDDVDFVFTRDESYAIGGVGPDDNGNGDFAAPRLIPGDAVGCVDWRSVVASSQGVWFQSHPDRLQMIPRGGGAAQWLGQPVRDTLAAFPRIVGAAVCSEDNTITWACQNAAGTASRLLAFDTRAGQWFVDELAELGGAVVQALCEHEGRLVLVADNEVWRQSATDTLTAAMATTVELGPFSPHGGPDGWGKLVGWTLTGECRGAAELDCDISYDDGTERDPAGDDPFTFDAVQVSQSVSAQWFPTRRKGSRYVVRFRQTAEAGGSGIAYNAVTLQVQAAAKPARLGAPDRR